MQFTYDEFCGTNILEIKDEVYNYLVKARRHKIDDEIYFRNLKDNNIYLYKIDMIDKKKAILTLISSEEKIILSQKKLHLGWSVVDPKTIEKYISSLNEMGVEKITFIYSDFSQKNFKINIETFIKENDDVYFLDFSNTSIDEKSDLIKTLVIGCEGGFSNKEREIFNKNNIVGFNSNLILRSETAIISASSKILL